MDEKHTKGKDVNDTYGFMTKKLIEKRTILIYGEITQDLAKEISMELLFLKELSDEPVTIFVNSQGGHVEAGDTIHDMIQYVGLPINMVGTGWVASAGTTIFLAAPKEKRVCLPNTRFMIHQPLGGVQGGATDIAIEAEEIVRIRKRIEILISDATGQSADKVHKDIERNNWMDTAEALAYGLISRVIKEKREIQ